MPGGTAGGLCAWWRWPRPEAILLLLGLVSTAGAKFIAARAYRPDGAMPLFLAGIAPDVVVFGLVTAALALGYAQWPGRVMARVGLLVGTLMFGWSVLNSAWMAVTGVQLQWGVVAVILYHPAEFWPVVPPHLKRHALLSACGGVLGLAVLAWAGWCFVRPAAIQGGRWWWTRRAISAGVVAAVFAVLGRGAQMHGAVASIGPVLGYSSHWLLAQCLVSETVSDGRIGGHERRVVEAGERRMALPAASLGTLPNVVLVFLESVSYLATEPGTAESEAVPTLRRLAEGGVTLTNTRAMVPQTGKAFWATLTGTTPDLGPDFVEALLTDAPVEGLPTLLRRVGYRSAFFQMAKGTFECAPGMFASLGFDWAWFRENLRDPSANLGYLSGDDFRMLDPVATWVAKDTGPFFLVVITSVAHDPYVVPAWFATPADSAHERYLQTLRYTDAFLAALWQRVEPLGGEGGTLLCVLGDHGESFRAEGHKIRWVPNEETLRVPWVLYWPGRVPTGVRYDWPCEQLDVAPTLLTLLGFEVSGAGFEGRDALTPTGAGRRSYFSAWYRGSPMGYVEGTRKRIYWPDSGDVLEYDLARDPEEQRAVVLGPAERDAVIAELDGWVRAAYIPVAAKRFRQRFVFDHWWVFSSGRYARAYFVP